MFPEVDFYTYELQGPGGPKDGVSQLAGGAGSLGHWLKYPRCPRARIDLVVGRAGACGVPGLMPACCYVVCVLARQAVGLLWSWG